MTTAIFVNSTIPNNATLTSSWHGETKQTSSICNNNITNVGSDGIGNNVALKQLECLKNSNKLPSSDGYMRMFSSNNSNQQDLITKNINSRNDKNNNERSDNDNGKYQNIQQSPIPSKPSQFLLAGKYLLNCSPSSSTNAGASSKSGFECKDFKTMEEFTCKIVPRNLAMLAAYHRLGSESSSPFVNQIVEAILAPKVVYFIMPKNYGNVHSYVLAKGKLKEAEAANIFKQMVSAVQYCHSKGVILRDIKLGKFVFVDKARSIIKLESLEDAVLLEDPNNDSLNDKHGCPNYVSPEKAEILTTNSKYSGKATDVWSLGVILHTMLVGRYPFNDTNIATLLRKIRNGNYVVPQGLSSSVSTLMKALLVKSPAQRPSCTVILKHPWILHHCVPNPIILRNSCGNWTSAEDTMESIPASKHILVSASDQVVPEL